MPRPVYILLTVAALISCTPGALARRLSVGNGDFSAQLVTGGHRIRSAAVVTPWTAYGQDTDLPLFELCINGRTVRSSDPLWDYAGASSERLSNGGTVVSYTFRGRKFLRGLTLVWDREYFPDAAFLRERLRLRSDTEGRFVLSNVEGRNRLVFPRYAFEARPGVSGVELRMARFGGRRDGMARHMNIPDTLSFVPRAEPTAVKGPLMILRTPDYQVITSYEHASQDHSWMNAPSEVAAGNDGNQGVKGRLDYLSDDDLWFIALEASFDGGRLVVDNSVRHGAYLDGEPVPAQGWYETVWSSLSIVGPAENAFDDIREYLFRRISDHALSRRAHFYYNTWGMQRDMPRDSLYLCMTEERLLREIDQAARMGVDCFVLDDGWERCFGDWRPHPERLPNGLKPLVDRMLSHGIRPGIWISLAGTHFDLEIAREHPEWLIRDAAGDPVKAQWRNPVFDICGPYYDILLQYHKDLIDQGIRYFKWDAFNTFSSDCPGLGHGDVSHSRRERLDRYNYLAPLRAVSLMREIREYCPDVVIENDLTEHERCMIGLAPLQEGKLYFVNNGISRYRDYSDRRSRSLRSVINRYAFFMPQEIFTYAFFPQDNAGRSLYNATCALSSGHGFWGNLDMTTPAQRSAIAALVEKASQVLPYVSGCPVETVGAVDDSPEIYLQRNPDNAYALLTAFAGEPFSQDVAIDVPASRVLAVLGCPFDTAGGGVVLPLRADAPDSFFHAFVIGGREQPARVISSTGPLERVVLTRTGIVVTAAQDAEIKVQLPGGTAAATLASGETVRYSLLP